MPFTHDAYRDMLFAILDNRPILTFRQADRIWHDPPARFCILRHDVEWSVPAAVAMAKIDAEVGVKSTFLFRVSGPYNPFYERTAPMIREIVGMGHELGLHYDCALIQGDRRALTAQLKALESTFGVIVDTVSPHQPNRGPVVDVPGWINAYDHRFFRNCEYASDSLQVWRDGGPLERLEHPRMQLLIHPDNWSESGDAWQLLMVNELEAEHAETMVDAFVEMHRCERSIDLRQSADKIMRERLEASG